MSVNTSATPDGRGVLIYNGEMILIYADEVSCHFENGPDSIFRGNKSGNLYLTSHRVIFINRKNDSLRSFSMPFHCMKNVKLEQPVFGANFLKGTAIAQPGGNWNGQVTFKLTFGKGGCIDFGMALLKAVDMAQRFRPYGSPPAYAPPPGNYFAAPPAYYIPSGGNYNGFQAPMNTFPNHPPAGDVYMYEAPPPYSGIGPNPSPIPAGQLQDYGVTPNAPPQQQMYAPPLPTKKMQSVSISFDDDQEIVVTDRGFVSDNIMSDFDQACQDDILNNVTVDGDKSNETGNYQTVYTEYQPLAAESSGLVTPSMSSIPTSESSQQLNQISSQQTITPANQFDHITVMTNLQQPTDLYGENNGAVPVSSSFNGITYTIPNSTNNAALQIYPPSAITQQVQQSVPALNAMPSTVMQSRPDYNSMQRLQAPRANNGRTKTLTYPSVLGGAGRGCNRQIPNMSVVHDDGPTVRQHLQQQHRARLQQQLAMQGKSKADKDDIIAEYLSPAADKMLPVSTTVVPSSGSTNVVISTPINTSAASSINVPASPSVYVLTSSSLNNIPTLPSINLPVTPPINISQSSSLNTLRVSQASRQQYTPRLAPPQSRIVADRARRVPAYDNQAYQPASSLNVLKQRAASDIHEEAIQRAAAVYNQIKAQKYPTSGANQPQPRNVAYHPSSPAATADAETAVETAHKKSPARKRNHSTISASQVRVTVLGTQSEPATQQIITESDHVLPIHGVAGLSKQSRTETTDTASGKNGPRTGEARQPWQFVRTANSASTVDAPLTTEHGSNDVGGPSKAQKSQNIQTNSNTFSLPTAEQLLTEPITLSANFPELGNGTQLSESIREVMAQIDDDVLNYTREAQYVRKLYFMKRLIESLVIKNGALCDEVSRLNQRIQTVVDERKVLAKRLQHHERNRIRRIQTKLKKQAAARAVKTNESQLHTVSVADGAEGSIPTVDIEVYESDESDKTIISSSAASPNTSTSMSRVETPEPASRNHEFVSKVTLVNTFIHEGGKLKVKSGLRRHSSSKRPVTDRKEKKAVSN
ncbi:unnamed protein product [Litomosoides sigmodontis]|uniref:GRAM domain-containing protein n=1 Tax=Litomosoides sigmodontis TaxID=42156 RepID=A0A3P6SYB8_LITSI|nr:unnamed protein product [Litomosoides sigmodontis]